MPRRSVAILLVLSVLVLCSSSLWSALDVAAQQVLRDVTINSVEVTPISNVRSRVTAYVSVTDLNSTPIKGLAKEHFTVTEDGATITSFDLQEAPAGLWVVLMMDTTTSMGADGLTAAKDAADRFVAGMADVDQVALYEFQEQATLREDFTLDKNRVRNSIRKLQLVDKWTCLYDAGYVGVNKAMEIKKGRRAVVLLTDGRDDRNGKPCSKVSADDLIAKAWTQGVPLYVVGLGHDIDEAGLKRIAEKTGGAYWSAPKPQDLEQAYAQIADLLRSQYVVAYDSRAAAGNHALVVRVDFHGQQALDGVGFINIEGPTPTPAATVAERTPPPTATTKSTVVSILTTPTPTPPPIKPPPPTISPTLIWLLLIAFLLAVGALLLLIIRRLRRRKGGQFAEERLGPTLEGVETGTVYVPPLEDEVTTEVSEDVVSQPLARLTVLSSLQLQEGESYDLYGRSIYIGRGPDNDIVVPDKPVSRAHAEVRYQGGDFYVFDRGSRFGTHVNGDQVPPQGIKLRDGDQLQLATRTTLRFTRLRVTGDEDGDRTQQVASQDAGSETPRDEKTSDIA